MFQGNWTCSSCGSAITELPFEPRSTDGLMCRDCHQKKKNENRSSAPRGERKMFQGDWNCASCGAVISELPFEPRETDNLKCRDCFKKDRV